MALVFASGIAGAAERGASASRLGPCCTDAPVARTETNEALVSLTMLPRAAEPPVRLAARGWPWSRANYCPDVR